MISTIKIGGSILDLSSPKVMAVLNATPDSFYEPSRYSASSISDAAELAIKAGAAILDVGGCSTRPGAKAPDVDEEYHRVHEAFSSIRERFPEFPLSLDTYRAEVVRKIVSDFGPVLVNDVSGGQDPEMFHTISMLSLPYVLCHMPCALNTMHETMVYDDIVSEMLRYFVEKLSVLLSMGVYDVILDPNFGFAKDSEQNFKVVSEYSKLRSLGFPLMAGVSHKRFVRSHGGDSLSATSAVHMTLLERGAGLLRVHDVETAISTINIYHEISNT